MRILGDVESDTLFFFLPNFIITQLLDGWPELSGRSRAKDAVLPICRSQYITVRTRAQWMHQAYR
jgi:hypothetical protein